MLDYTPTKTQKLLGNPDKADNPTASSPACAGLAGEHCILGCIEKKTFFYFPGALVRKSCVRWQRPHVIFFRFF